MTTGDPRPKPAPVGSWGRAKVLALLVAGALAGLLLLVGLGLALYYGLDDGEERTLEEIGSLLGITRERVRQIEQHALATLARQLGSEDEVPAKRQAR